MQEKQATNRKRVIGEERGMSLQPQFMSPIPQDTLRIARAAYPKGNLYLRLRDHLGTIYEDRQFADLYPNVGQPAHAPWRLALISLMQFLEGMSDRQAADAVRGRIDWKYLLGLELTDSGFDHTVLSEFRTRLLIGQSEHLLFETLVTLRT
jgi:transposase